MPYDSAPQECDRHGLPLWRTGPGLPVPNPKALQPARTRRYRAKHPGTGEVDTDYPERAICAYAEFLRKRDGKNVEFHSVKIVWGKVQEPGKARPSKRARAVVYRRAECGKPTMLELKPGKHRSGNAYHSVPNPNYKCAKITALVRIPNWDHVPTMVQCDD